MRIEYMKEYMNALQITFNKKKIFVKADNCQKNSLFIRHKDSFVNDFFKLERFVTSEGLILKRNKESKNQKGKERLFQTRRGHGGRKVRVRPSSFDYAFYFNSFLFQRQTHWAVLTVFKEENFFKPCYCINKVYQVTSPIT